MKKSNFNAKEFLKVKVLSPLEENKLKGGLAMKVQQIIIQQQQQR